MSDLSVQIRITAIRSRGKFGGVIFSGVTDAGSNYVANCDFRLVPDASMVDKGQLWKVSGSSHVRNYEINGFRRKEIQIEARDAELVRPSGTHLISWIAECPDCRGIGMVKAQKLFDRFGTELINHIEQKNLDALKELLNDDAAQSIIMAFEKHKVARTLQWLDQVGMPRRIGASVVSYYKDEAREKVEANPYVLLSFEASWDKVDELARNRFGVQLDDPRRLLASVEEVLYRGLKAGHTCLPDTKVYTGLTSLLKSPDLANQALAAGDSSDQFKRIGGYFQPTGTYLIESHVAEQIHKLVAGINDQGQGSIFLQAQATPNGVESVIESYEREQNIKLAPEQRNAVLTSVSSHMSLILGGAGTGKTTVLKALYRAFNELYQGVVIYQIALAGRAAQRMSEATGLDSMTIAGFLASVESGQIEMGSVIVIDEMSMVDIILMYRLLRHLPSGIRLILVGDPSQLPPIGPGLVLHALAGLSSISQTELKVVQRQSSASGIPQVAAAIRNHEKPTWASYNGKPESGVSFISCSPSELESTLERVYGELGGKGENYSVQILSLTNTSMGGVRNINTALHNRYRQDAELVHAMDAEFGRVGGMTLDSLPLRVGDLVIFTENDYELGLRNGSLGTIVKALPVEQPNDPCCICDFEGIEFRLNSFQLNALRHAYSITVHKSQGSQFRRVIVPIRATRMLDQALIYTAVTRGVDQVVLVGDEAACLEAINAPARASQRHITLPMFIKQVSISTAQNPIQG